MGCFTQERDILGLGVRLGLYAQTLAFVILLWRGGTFQVQPVADSAMVTNLALVISIAAQMMREWPDYFSDKEMVVLSYMMTLYVIANAVGRLGKAAKYWVVWARNAGAGDQVKRARRHLRYHSALTIIPQLATTVLLLAFWSGLYKWVECDGGRTTYGFLYYKLPAYGWLRTFHIVANAVSLFFLVVELFFLAHLNNHLVQVLFIVRILTPTNQQEREMLESLERSVVANMGCWDGFMFRLIAGNIQQSLALHIANGAANEDDDATPQGNHFNAFIFLLMSASQVAAVELCLVWNRLGVAISESAEWNDLLAFSQLFPLSVGLVSLYTACLPLDIAQISQRQFTHLMNLLQQHNADVLDA